jgi:hypothetical protein
MDEGLTEQDLYGQSRDGASQIANETTAAASRTASSFESSLRNTIEEQPYTAVFVVRDKAGGPLMGCHSRSQIHSSNEFDVATIAGPSNVLQPAVGARRVRE